MQGEFLVLQVNSPCEGWPDFLFCANCNNRLQFAHGSLITVFSIHGVQVYSVFPHIRRLPFYGGKHSCFLYQVVPSLPLLRQVFFIYEKFDLYRSLVIFTIGHRNPSLLLWNISNQKGQLLICNSVCSYKIMYGTRL